ncbi:MAG: hypothetical protein IJU45_04475, partial [Clostridia bacterium]|nr:hypothetical protein [Clostridia bacterium]
MFDSLKTNGGNNFGDNELAFIKQAKPFECGGTDAALDKTAPKQIDSEDMILFDATSSFAGMVSINLQEESPAERLGYVSAFAAPLPGGTFIFLEKSTGFNYGGERKRFLAPVKENVFPALVELVREFDFAKSNGFHSATYGLPENFGGSVNIRYASGEMISFSNNQSAVISPVAGQKIADIFTCAFNGEKISLPDVSQLKEIVYSEQRENGGFTKSVLTLNPDGTGTNKKSSRYDDPTV